MFTIEKMRLAKDTRPVDILACHCIPQLEQSSCRVVMPLLALVELLEQKK